MVVQRSAREVHVGTDDVGRPAVTAGSLDTSTLGSRPTLVTVSSIWNASNFSEVSMMTLLGPIVSAANSLSSAIDAAWNSPIADYIVGAFWVAGYFLSVFVP